MTADRLERDDRQPRRATWPGFEDDAPTDPQLPVVPGPPAGPVHGEEPGAWPAQTTTQAAGVPWWAGGDRLPPPPAAPDTAAGAPATPVQPSTHPPPPVVPPDPGPESPGSGRWFRPPREAPARGGNQLPRNLSDIPAWKPIARHGEVLTSPRPRPDPDDPGPATQPLPAIDIADFEASSALTRDQDIVALQPEPADQAGLKSVARGGALNLAGALISAVSTLGITIAVTRQRQFSPPIAGAFFTAMSLFLIVEAIANLGAYNGAIYFIARLRALHSERRIPAILRATVIPVIFSSLIAAVLLIMFARPLAGVLLDGRPDVNMTKFVNAVRVMAVALPFAAMADTLLGASRGYRQMRPTVLVDKIGRSALQLAGVLVAALGASTLLLAPLWALPYLPACLVAYFWFRRINRRNRLRASAAAGSQPSGPRPRLPAGPPASLPPAGPPSRRPADEAAVDNRHGRPNARGFWRFTAPRSVASVAQIIIQRLDILLVARFLGFQQAAIYTAATRFLVAGQLGNAAISMAAQPQFTHLFALRDRRGANSVYQVTTGWLVLLTWPLYLLVVVFGPVILTVFGHQYQTSGAAAATIILALTMLVATGCGQVDMVLITTGRSSWSLANGLVAMVANVAFDLVLIPRYGIAGAAIGWAAAIVLSNLMPLIQVAVAYRLHPFGQETAAACVLATVSFLIVPWAVRSLTKPLHVVGHTAPAIAGVAAGCAAMTAGLWLLRGTLQLSIMPGLASIFGRPVRRSG